MRVLLVAENQAAAVRVDRGQVDAVAAQQRQQQVRTDVTEVAGDDAVKVPRRGTQILQQRGKGVGSSGGRWSFRTMRSFRAFEYSPVLPHRHPKI